METNEAGFSLIKEFEGLKLEAYKDIAGIWTIGHGHTKTAKSGMKIDHDRAHSLLKSDVKEAEDYVNRVLGETVTTPNEFAAMVALAYNIGIGNFGTSTVLREHKAGNKAAAAAAFKMWNRATINGVKQEVAGLTRRREAESKLYLKEV